MTDFPRSRILILPLFVTAFLFIAAQFPSASFFHIARDNTFFYLAFVIFGIASVWLSWQTSHQRISFFAREMLYMYAPIACLFAIGTTFSSHFHFLVSLAVGLYVISAFAYWSFLIYQKQWKGDASKKKLHSPALSLTRFHTKHGTFPLASVFCLTLLFFAFAATNLTHFAAVDEPLWMDGRITRFWKNLSERDLEKTNISDKPGITVALASGAGLFFVEPKEYRDTRFVYAAKNADADIKDLYLAFRLPLLLVITAFLPFFYFLLVPLFGATVALYSYAFIALSPLLIGMSKIVNPDSLLWLFVPLSFLSFLVFVRKKSFGILIVSGVFLGLALLTKYVANFLILYFFGYLFLRYLLEKSEGTSFADYFKNELQFFLIWLGTGLSVLYLLFPALWVEPARILSGTLYSQAFEKVAPLFIGLIAFILIDQYLWRSRVASFLMEYGRRGRFLITWLFLGFFLSVSLMVIANSMLGMLWIDFMSLLASPKSTSMGAIDPSIFLTNFYPLLFGIPVITLLGVLIAVLATLFKNTHDTSSGKEVIALVVFILLYFVGSTVNEVVLINRYQIVLYPLMGVLGGIGFSILMSRLKKKFQPLKKWDDAYRIGFFFVVFCLCIILIRTPFPLSYASALLPPVYTIDIKDMGSGSYEAAEYLNSLPDAHSLAIWTDKRGVCKFFVGTCLDGFNFSEIPSEELDYVIISTGRESRTERMLVNPYLLNDEGLIRFDTYYQKTDPVYELLINGRAGQFVRIFPFTPLP